MEFWGSSAFWTSLSILGLLFAVELLASLIPSVRRLGVPLAILAGVLGLLGSQQVLDLYELDIPFLESSVYHGLGLLFIALSLRTPAAKRGSGRDLPALSIGFGIPMVQAAQAFAALLVLLVVSSTWHPGLAMLVPMGFEQGPGQALSMGAAWEKMGLENGGQLGLICAALGYGWAVVVGVPLALVGRKRGWLASTQGEVGASVASVEQRATTPGGLDHLSVQLALIALCYGLTYGLCTMLARALPADIAPVVWSVHFIFGAVIAMGLRTLIARFGGDGDSPIDDYLMVRIGGLVVDLVTCAALAAIQIAVLRAYWVPLLLLTSVGGLLTLLVALWFGSRSWVDAPFEHALLWFGMSTGTLPTGLALLRIVDPELRTPAANSAVLGAAMSIPLVAPLILVLVPMSVKAYQTDWPTKGWVMLAVFGVYTLVLIIAWAKFGGLRLRRPLARMWAPAPADESAP